MDDIEMKLMSNFQSKLKKVSFKPIKSERIAYFYLKPADKFDYVSYRLNAMKLPFLNALQISDFKPINYRSTEPFYTFGLISSPNGSKIASESSSLPADAFIFNTLDHSNINVRLDLSAADSYSLFNGQIAVIKGTSSRGDTILVEKIISTPCLETPVARKSKMSMVVSKGPYSPSSLLFLLGRATDVFVCMGPFTGPSGAEFRSFSDFLSSLGQAQAQFQSPRVVLVPSMEDHSTIQVFPQPPIRVPETSASGSKVYSHSNPASFYLNDHMVLISNIDIYLDMASEEISTSEVVPGDVLFSSDRIQRLASHLVFQQTLVPVLNPRPVVAFGPWLQMPCAPNLYIVTSKMKGFSRVVGKTTVVNVGGIGRGGVEITGGTEIDYKVEVLSFS